MNKQYNIYNVDLKIDVQNQFLYSNAKVNYHCNLPCRNVLIFYIYKSIEVDEIICDRTIKYEVSKEVAEWSPFVLESKLIRITFDEPIFEDEIISIFFKYKGYINIVTQYGINRLSKDWIELGIYTPWFPLSEKLEQVLFNVNIHLDDGYKVINSREFKGYSVINQTVPNIDCPIIASNCFKCIKCNFTNINVNIYYTEDKFNDLAQQISDYTKMILHRYIRFGNIDSEELSIVIAPREDCGGYCRPGLIVLIPNDDAENETDYFKFIAHEIAHLWWCKSKNVDTWEYWLNESFAEFSALLALREFFGEEAFNSKISIYTQKTIGLPPIKNLERGDDNAHQVLYMKGPLILNELEIYIGKEKFEELLNEVYINNIDTTEKFLDKLIEITSQEVKETFNSLLLQ